jgi:uncharacterized protein
MKRGTTGLRAALAALALLSGMAGFVEPGRTQTAPEPACETGNSLVPSLQASGRLAAIEARAAETPNGEGRLWRVEKNGLPPSFLFGTMHLSDPRVLALSAPVRTAFDASGTVVIETLDVLDKAKATFGILAFPELVNLPAGKVLDDYLTPDEKRDVERLLATSGTPYESIRTLQPWLFAMGLMLPACEAMREAAGAEPLDVRIARDAEKAGKRLAGLESMEEQLRAMASMRMELQTASLVAILKLRDRIPDLFETMTEFYLAGRIAAITPLTDTLMPVEDMAPPLREAYRDFEKQVVVSRNHRMAERAAPYFTEGGTFLAVGALHLPGEEGLVELLRAGGYRVTRAD